jgi:hypothetical protein
VSADERAWDALQFTSIELGILWDKTSTEGEGEWITILHNDHEVCFLAAAFSSPLT